MGVARGQIFPATSLEEPLHLMIKIIHLWHSLRAVGRPALHCRNQHIFVLAAIVHRTFHKIRGRLSVILAKRMRNQQMQSLAHAFPQEWDSLPLFSEPRPPRSLISRGGKLRYRHDSHDFTIVTVNPCNLILERLQLYISEQRSQSACSCNCKPNFEKQASQLHLRSHKSPCREVAQAIQKEICMN